MDGLPRSVGLVGGSLFISGPYRDYSSRLPTVG